jgi:prolyl-tRNA synthetase
VSRALAAVIEQHADEDGVAWPISVAPYEVAIIPLGSEDEVLGVAERVFADLASAGVEAVIDDRDERAGVKFADADLVGYPYQIVVGRRSVAEGSVEVKERHSGERGSVSIDEAVPHVTSLVEAAKQGLEPRTARLK